MKILITNTVALNGGDAAILEGILVLLRTLCDDNTEFIIYDSQPAAANQNYPNLNFSKLLYLQATKSIKSKWLVLPKNYVKYINKVRFYIGAWCWKNDFHFMTKLIMTKSEMKSLSDYSSADLIVSTGGTYLVESYSIEPRIFDYKISLLMGKPLIFFTQSLGPFTIPKNRHSLKQIFEKSPLILLRDHKSQNHIIELGIEKDNTYVTADAAFALADPLAIATAKNTTHLSSPPRIAISVRDWKHFKTVEPAVGREKYLRAIKDLTVHLVEKHNAKITYISTCQGIPEYWTDDSKFALEIAARLPGRIADSVTVNRDFHSPKALAEIAKNYDIVIATRLHMAILSLGAGIPVFPIAYEFKTKELFNKLGQGHWTVDIEEIEPQSLLNSVDLFLDSIPEICQTLFPAVEREREQAWETSSLVKKAYEQWQKVEPESYALRIKKQNLRHSKIAELPIDRN